MTVNPASGATDWMDIVVLAAVFLGCLALRAWLVRPRRSKVSR
jgi:hypothetical protein